MQRKIPIFDLKNIFRWQVTIYTFSEQQLKEVPPTHSCRQWWKQEFCASPTCFYSRILTFASTYLQSQARIFKKGNFCYWFKSGTSWFNSKIACFERLAKVNSHSFSPMVWSVIYLKQDWIRKWHCFFVLKKLIQ